MSKHGQPMSQTLAEMQMNELKMNDPKLNKIFDKLKKGDKVKLKTSSTISKGSDFVDYIVKSKNVVNKGRVEKITLATVGNEKAVKKFLYKRDGKVTFAIGDMGASIDDIREKYSLINHEIIEEIEVEELDEGMAYKFAAVDKKGLVIGFASKESDAKDMARRNKGRVVTLTKPLPDNKKSDMMINRPLPDGMDKFPTNTSATQGKRMEEVEEGAASDARRSMSKDRDLVRRGRDSADVDDTASDADKKSAMKNVIMQMRQSLDSKGSKPIQFDDGKSQKVDPKILTLLTKAHDQIQKPRDKEQFVKMISKSYRDMLKVSKMVGKQLRMGEEIVLDEGFSPKEIKMAIGIASDPRYKQGNYSGAVKQIEKIKKGLSTHKQVAAVLKRQNEDLDEAKFSNDMIDKLKKTYEPLKGKKVNPTPLMKIFDKIDSNKAGLEQLYKADIPFVSMMAMSRLMLKHNYKADDINKLGKIRREDFVEEVELQEKYDLYHKSFSDAMQHAYDYAKKKMGITVDPKEIDSKVATGPKKPSEGKTNKYRLKGKGGNLQIQVYNKGGSKPFELNMYKEENEMTKSLKDTIVEMWSEAVSPAQQAAIAISKKEKEQDEGNAFGAALQAARENGDETFVVAGKTYKCEDYDEEGAVKEFVQSDGVKRRVKEGDNRLKSNKTETNKNNKSDDGDGMDAVQPKAVKKKFKDRKDKDIDNDGDVDDSDKFLHKRRKAVSKAINSQKESIERYHETKKGSLRDAVLQMWGEKHTPDHKEDEKNEKKSLTKEKKSGTKNMTDTGKEMTKVDVDVKMPKMENKKKV